MAELSPIEQTLYATVKITANTQGRSIGTGTGFFWSIQKEGVHTVVIVTNNHVIDGADEVLLDCHLGDGSDPGNPIGATTPVRIQMQDEGIVRHPDPNVDLCAFGFAPMVDKAVSVGTPLFYKTLSSDLVPTGWSEFDAVEDVMMVGCPRGIMDDVNKFALIRRGITATAVYRNYNGANEFLVDMACFPGSSGSPVFLLQRGYVEKSTGNYLLDGVRFFLMGVLHAGPIINNAGQIVLGHLPTVTVATMMHLGQVIRSDAVIQLESEVIARMKQQRSAGN